MRIALVLLFGMMTLCSYSQGIVIDIVLEEDPEMKGWTEEEPPEVYEGEALFDLINGGADLYYEYGFERVISYRFIHENGSRIQAEMYEMNSDSSAYGLFSLIKPKDGESLFIDQECLISNDYIACWRDDHYIVISGSLTGDIHSQALVRLAQLLSEKVGSEGDAPVLTAQFAGENLDRLIYFKGNIALTNVYSFDYKDVFEIEDGAILEDENGTKAIIFRYKDEGKAGEIFQKASGHFTEHRKFSNFRENDNYFVMTDRKGREVTFSYGKNHLLGAVHPEMVYGMDIIAPLLEMLEK
jgi:hypothetical protein